MALIKLPLPQDSVNTTFMGLVDPVGQQWTVWHGRNVNNATINGQSTPLADLGVVLLGSNTGNTPPYAEIVGLNDSLDSIAPINAVSTLRTASLLYGFDGTNYRRLQVDSAENLKVTSQGTALYLTQTVTPSGTAWEFQLGSIGLAGNSVFDAKTALVVIVNNSNQPIVNGTLQFTDTIGAVGVSLYYYLTPNASLNIAANGGHDTFFLPLTQGIMKTVNLSFNYGSAVTSGTVSCLVVLQGPGGPAPRANKSPSQQVGVSTTVGEIVGANPQRLSITFYNPGPGTLWLGHDGTTAVGKGIPVVPGGTLTDDLSWDTWYGLMDAGVGNTSIVYVETASDWQV